MLEIELTGCSCCQMVAGYLERVFLDKDDIRTELVSDLQLMHIILPCIKVVV